MVTTACLENEPARSTEYGTGTLCDWSTPGHTDVFDWSKWIPNAVSEVVYREERSFFYHGASR